MTAKKKVNKGSSPKDTPSGMPPLNSLIGKTVASRVKAISFVIICYQNGAGASFNQEGLLNFPAAEVRAKMMITKNRIVNT